jgi:hypothetical protein
MSHPAATVPREKAMKSDRVVAGIQAAPFGFGKRRQAGDPGADCATVPIQPMPILTRVSHLETEGGPVTAIMRHWNPGDSGDPGRCKLCAKCQAYNNGCLILVGGFVPRERAPLYNTNRSVLHRAPLNQELWERLPTGAGWAAERPVAACCSENATTTRLPNP